MFAKVLVSFNYKITTARQAFTNLVCFHGGRDKSENIDSGKAEIPRTQIKQARLGIT